MGHFVQLVVDVDGYEKENREAIVAAVNDTLDWSKVELGDEDGFLKYEGSLSYDWLCERTAATELHDAIVKANAGRPVHVKCWFYDLEDPFQVFEFDTEEMMPSANEQNEGAVAVQDDEPVHDAEARDG